MKSGPFKLKYFNPALVDHFCTELTLHAVRDPENYLKIRSYIHNFKQKRDFRKSLLLAEEYVLKLRDPDFRQNIQGQDLETWIKAIHQRVAKTLLAEWKRESGTYSNVIAFRWEKRIEFGNALESILNTRSQQKIRLQALFQKNNLGEIFPVWYETICQCAKMKFDKDTLKTINYQKTYAAQYLYRLAYARHLDKLTPAQAEAVDKVCKMVMPETLSQSMNTFCESLAERIRHCDGELENVADLTTFVFQNLTKIHPFPNGNGRTSSILLNLILLGFNYPSIVLRKQIDREDETTYYNFVFSKIYQDLSPFKEFIKMKVQENQESPEKGTVESTPHIHNESLKLIDGFLSLVKPCRNRLQEHENDPVKVPREFLNHFLKIRLDAMGQDYGFDMLYLPPFVDYSEKDMQTLQKGTFKH